MVIYCLSVLCGSDRAPSHDLGPLNKVRIPGNEPKTLTTSRDLFALDTIYIIQDTLFNVGLHT